jgi:hypothetical protein
MDQCIEEGVRCGLARAFKHTDKPTEETIVKEIFTGVRDSIDNYWIYEDEPK